MKLADQPLADDAVRYSQAVKPLPPAASSKLGSVIRIVRIQNHKAELARLSNLNAADQLLFLVKDSGNPFNKDQIMLHNGRGKLGYVDYGHTAQVASVIDELSSKEGTDQVLVVCLSMSLMESQLKDVTSIAVTPMGYVYERIARKFSRKENLHGSRKVD